MGFRRVRGGSVRDAGLLRDPLHDQLVAVRVVDRRHVLHDARDALEKARAIDPTDPRVKANLEELDALEHGAVAP